MVKFNISGEFITGSDFNDMIIQLGYHVRKENIEHIEIESSIGGKLIADFEHEDLDAIIKNDNINNKSN